MFILFFASSALVPVATMPGWLQPFAENQPASVTIQLGADSLRRRTGVPQSVASLPVVHRDLRVFLVLSLNLYRRATV